MSNIMYQHNERHTCSVRREAIFPCSIANHVNTPTKSNRNIYALHHKHVVDSKDVDRVDALGLELVEIFDVSWDMQIARRSERSRNTDLQKIIIIK